MNTEHEHEHETVDASIPVLDYLMHEGVPAEAIPYVAARVAGRVIGTMSSTGGMTDEQTAEIIGYVLEEIQRECVEAQGITAELVAEHPDTIKH
jgi:hypothetical protein